VVADLVEKPDRKLLWTSQTLALTALYHPVLCRMRRAVKTNTHRLGEANEDKEADLHAEGAEGK
jgi:hypothetical protein